jgi:hypothetical protein
MQWLSLSPNKRVSLKEMRWPFMEQSIVPEFMV